MGSRELTTGPRRAGRLVIGIGNSLRQDDGVGWRVAEALAARVEAGALGSLEVLAVQQLTPELVEPIAAAGAVVLVDAVLAGGTEIPAVPGRETVAGPTGREPTPAGLEPLRLEPLRPASVSTRAPLSHHAAPAALLALCTALHGGCPPAWQLLIPIAPTAIGFGDTLSPATSARLMEALSLLESWAREPAAVPGPSATTAAAAGARHA